MTTKTERIDLRATERQRALLTAASEAEGSSLTDFVLRTATQAAETLLADRRVFVLDDARWSDLQDVVDRPARDVPGLRELLARPTVLDQD